MVSPAQWLLLTMNTAVSVEDAAHGLARDGITPGFTAIGLRAVMGCATLEAAIHAVQRLYGMASRSIRLDLATNHDHAIVSVEADCDSQDDAAVLEDTYLGWMFMHCMYFLGRSLPVIEVTTRDRTHFNMGRSHYGIGAPVRHGRVTSMRFGKSLLAMRGGARHAGDNAHWECFRLWLEFVENGWTDRLPVAYGPGLAPPRLGELARRSKVSPSTMRRRLQPIEGGFRLSRQRALTEAAIALLCDSDASVESIGAELGYSDARSFRRFLKAATGKTPQELRLSGPDAVAHNDHLVRQRLREIGGAIAL
jgi:AraC-like DNA-binding protein